MRVVDSWSPTHLNVRVLNVSKSGLKLHVPKFLERGTLVQVHLQGLAEAGLSQEGLMAVAEVRYCAVAGDGFVAGVVFHDLIPEEDKYALRVTHLLLPAQ